MRNVAGAEVKRGLLLIVVLTGCVSVPRDGGLSEVQQTFRERTNIAIGSGDVEQLLAGELTADEAVAISLTNNPRLNVILSELDVARADLLDATTISNPILEFEWRVPKRPYNPFEVTIAQSILDLVQLPRRRAVGRAVFEAAKSRVAAEVLAVAAGVRDDYYALLASTQRLAASRTATEAARTAAELALRQHSAGNITDLELEHHQAAYEQAKVTLSRDEEELLVLREALLRGMGLRDASVEWTLAADFPPLPEREPEIGEIDLAARRLDLIVATRELDALRQSLGLARLESIGEIVVDLHREREPEGEITTGPGIEVPIPIFNRGTARRARARAELTRAEQNLLALSVEAASHVRVARERLLAARARVEYYRDVIVPRRTRIVELTKLEQNAMLLGLYDVLRARQDETEARRELADVQREYWQARNEFERAVNGVGAMDDLSTESTGRESGRNRSIGRSNADH